MIRRLHLFFVLFTCDEALRSPPLRPACGSIILQRILTMPAGHIHTWDRPKEGTGDGQ